MMGKKKAIKYLAIALAVLLIAGILSGICGVVVAIFGLENEVQLADEPFVLEVDSDGSDLRELVIRLASTKLTVCAGETIAVETDHPHVTCQLREGILTLEQAAHGTRVLGISFGTTAQSGSVTLTLPETVLENLRLEAGAGDISIDRLCTKRGTMDFGAGNVEIGFLSVTESIEIEGGVGNLTVKDGVLRNPNLDMGVGDVSIRGTLEGACEINLGIGSTRLEIAGNEADYRITLDKGIGKATVNGKTVKGGETYGNGAHSINIDGGIGSIAVLFTPTEATP